MEKSDRVIAKLVIAIKAERGAFTSSPPMGTYKGFFIDRNYKYDGQPDSWKFHHQNYDGAPDAYNDGLDPRHGYAKTASECIEAIKELEANG